MTKDDLALERVSVAYSVAGDTENAMNNQHSQIGMHYLDLETPALLVDLAVMERNLHQMASFFAGIPANLRPHTKTHRAPAIARLQIAAGAVGICCGNLADAEIMSDQPAKPSARYDRCRPEGNHRW
jgi:hypothetical protein